MLSGAMSSFAPASTSAATPVKCRAEASSPSVDAIHARAAFAFSAVSTVVIVFETTAKRVSLGSRSRVASARSAGSTFETKRTTISLVA